MKNLKALLLLSVVLCSVITVAAEPIYLYDINITANSTWEYEQPFEIIVNPLNMTGGLIDVTNVQIILLEDVNYSKTSLSRLDVGVYAQSYTINKSTNLTTIHFNVTAVEREKYVTKTIEITFVEDGVFYKIWNTTQEYWKNTKEMFLKNIDNYWIIGGIALFLVLTLVLFLDMLFKHRKK